MKNDEIKKAFESLTPDDAARERMLQGIMARSAAMKQEASAEPETAPWYIRFRTPIGFCAAAMACVMVFTIAVSNPAIVQNGSSRQQLLETRPAAAVTTAARVTELSAVTEAAEAQITAYTTSPATGGTAAAVTEATEAAEETETVVSTAAPPTTKPVVHSSLTTETTVVQLTTAETEAVTTAASAETVTTTTEVSIKQSLYGDLYDFNLVTWAGRSYATDYAVADYSQLSGKHLGSGVAMGENAEGIYTILLYELQGVPVEEGFAVQYAGQTAYYIFYSID